MKNQFKNLLPRKVFKRVAQNYRLFKIKPVVPVRWFRWLTLVFIISFSLLGYYPTLGVPPIKKSFVFAQSKEQKAEVISASFSKPLALPHPGYLSTRFSTWHPGIDIASGLGMPIHPIIDGEVIDAGFDIFGLGNYVTLSHQNNFTSKYAHLGKIYVKKGDKLTTDNTLGEVGLTGHTSGPHTHLEITHNGVYIDPLGLLPTLPDMPTATTIVKK